MRALWIALILTSPALAGCLTPADQAGAGSQGPLTVRSIDPTGPTGALVSDVLNATQDLALLDRLLNATGTYFATGYNTFEPTIGATSSGNLFTNSFRGLGSGTLIIRSTDQGQTWTDVTPRLPTGMKTVPNSNDPFMYVDPYTDRIYDFDMCVTLQGFCIAYSDDEGESWIPQGIAHGFTPVLDHQSIAAAPDRIGLTTPLYPNVLVFCVNRGVGGIGVWCASSFDSGFNWNPMVPGYPVGTDQCWGLHGHLEGGPDGRFYRGNPACGGHPAIYKSEDSGLTWTEHIVSRETGILPGIYGHEVAVATDDENNVYAFWVGRDGLPYLSHSTDHAATWSPARMVAAPGVTATGFPAVTAGAEGRVAWTYIGSDMFEGYDGERSEMNWTGYIGFSINYLDGATVVNVPVNTADDPLDAGRACGAIRCGGFGDFVSITLDAEGRPWAALANNVAGGNTRGIVGTLASGPSLTHEGDLAPLVLGPGADQWG